MHVSELEKIVRQTLKQVVADGKFDLIATSEDLFANGLDSIDMMTLVLDLEECLHVEVSDESTQGFRTIDDVIEAFREEIDLRNA